MRTSNQCKKTLSEKVNLVYKSSSIRKCILVALCKRFKAAHFQKNAIYLLE